MSRTVIAIELYNRYWNEGCTQKSSTAMKIQVDVQVLQVNQYR